MQHTPSASRRGSLNPDVVNLHQSPQRGAADGSAPALPVARAAGPAAAPANGAAGADLELGDFHPPTPCMPTLRSCAAEAAGCVLDHAPAAGRFIGKLAVASACASALAVLVVGMGGGFAADDDYTTPAWMAAALGAGAKAVWDGLTRLYARC